MKRLGAALFAVVVLALTACGDDDDQPTDLRSCLASGQTMEQCTGRG